jgi:hypothetical protein
MLTGIGAVPDQAEYSIFEVCDRAAGRTANWNAAKVEAHRLAGFWVCGEHAEHTPPGAGRFAAGRQFSLHGRM